MYMYIILYHIYNILCVLFFFFIVFPYVRTIKIYICTYINIYITHVYIVFIPIFLRYYLSYQRIISIQYLLFFIFLFYNSSLLLSFFFLSFSLLSLLSSFSLLSLLSLFSFFSFPSLDSSVFVSSDSLSTTVSFFLSGSTGAATFLANILPIKRCNGRICAFTSLDVNAGVSVFSTLSCFFSFSSNHLLISSIIFITFSRSSSLTCVLSVTQLVVLCFAASNIIRAVSTDFGRSSSSA